MRVEKISGLAQSKSALPNIHTNGPKIMHKQEVVQDILVAQD